jgi:hypothetical protein
MKRHRKMSIGKRPEGVAVQCRKQLLALVTSLPEATAASASERHLSLEVRGKRFGWFLENHHGDGRLALNLRAGNGVSGDLVAKAPGRFHIPKYIGHHGWIGVWLDIPDPDWNEISKLIEDAYLLTAPKRLAKFLLSTSKNNKI